MEGGVLTVSEYAALASLGINLLIAAVGGTWGIAKLRVIVSDEMDRHREAVDSKMDVMTRNFGEGLSALRNKIHEIETWARDEFVRRGSFEIVTARMEKNVGDQFDKLDRRLERMELKIDKVTRADTD